MTDIGSDRPMPSVALGDSGMAALIRAKDWAATPLGAPETWPPALTMMVSLLLANRFPQLLWWGPDYISIYNDAYRPVLGTKHPAALGMRFREVWPEVAGTLTPLIDTPFNGGPSSWTDDIPLELHRHGFTEEAHFTFAYSPVPDASAPRGIGGVLATVCEITEKAVGERRLAVLRDLGRRAGEARSVSAACDGMRLALSAHRLDLPFALIYLTDDTGEIAHLAGAAGASAGDAIAPATMALTDSRAVWPLVYAAAGAAPTVDRLQDRFAAVPPSPWAEPPHQAVVRALLAGHKLVGFLIAGVSPRLRLDQHYLTFLDLVADQIATAIGNARAYEEAQARAEALAAIDRAKTAFLSNVSHEFRTPLTLLLGPVEDLLEGGEKLQGAQRERLDMVRRNALRMQRLVNALLDFSRVEAGRLQAVYQPTDLAALTRDLASSFRAACEKAGLRLTIRARRLAEPVFVDRALWETITLNLISNAFKFTLDGGIDISLALEDGHAVLRVRDTGSGIPEGEVAHVFDRFHRVEGIAGRTHEGTGIGLALVQELTRLHGGTVEVTSQLGIGSTFAVRLPLGTAHLPPDRVRLHGDHAGPSARAAAFVSEAMRWLPAVDIEADPVPATATGGIILIADDNADMRDYLRQLLVPHYDVRLVGNGRDALAAIRAQRPDILLTDIMMPVMDGFALLRAIRADPGLADLPVVFLSARAGEEATIEGLDAGADDYLIKPFGARELIARVAANLERARGRRQIEAGEERFRALVAASSDVVYRMSADWRDMLALDGRGFLADAAGRGFLADAAAPSESWIETYLLPADRPHILATIAAAVGAKTAFQLEHRVRRQDGGIGWVFSRAIPQFDRDGNLIEWLGAATNITERIAEQRRAVLLAALTEEIALGQDPQEIAFAAAAMLGKALAVDRTGYGAVGGADEFLQIERGWHAPGADLLPAMLELGAFGDTIDALRRHCVVIVADSTEDPRTRLSAEHLQQIGLRAFAAAPICEQGRLVAILIAASAEPYPWSEAETRLIQDVATRTRAAVERARAVKAMREREAELRDANETLERRVAEALAERRLMAELIQMTDTFVQVLDREFRVLAINPANVAEYEKIYGFRPKIGESIAEHLADRPELREQVLTIWSRALGGEAFTVTQEFGDPSHRRRAYEVTLRPLRDTEGRVIGAYQFSTDVTERRLADIRLAEAQEQLRQSQKMEAVGQLTGGIAHDFNNLLAGIIGSLELLERRVGDGRLAGIERYIDSARTASQRAAALTQRLLAFSRRQTLAPRSVDLNRVAVDMVELIRRSVGPAVEVQVAGDAALWMIRVDVSQIESALLNLCLNARDAMAPLGGKLTIETENAALDERMARRWELPPGHYVRLSVRDTGVGMPPDVIARAFEPFFTTKPLGRGTGLGLSMVHGFVQQSKGQVKIESEPGCGTTITIHLPRFLGLAERNVVGSEERGRNGAGQTILVVDDEPTVRLFMVDTLRDSGYRVVDAADGSGALQILQSKAQIDLLISDVGLPGNLNGRQVADAARASRADLKVLFVTGYVENLALREGDLDWGMEVITKPFVTSALVAKVRDLLSAGL